MNYQNNIDAYYAYAKENHKRRKKEERLTWIWLIVSIIILFLVWFYFSNLNLFGTKDMDTKNSVSKIATVKKVETKEETRILKERTPYDLVNTKESENKKIVVEKINQVLPKKSMSPVSPGTLVKGDDLNGSVEKNLLMVLEKKSDVNSLNDLSDEDKNASLKLVTDIEINSSVEREQNSSTLKVAKLEENSSVEQNISVDLYHIYVVSKGESIYDIASKEYGDTKMYIKIVNANPDITNPNNIREGQELFLPIVSESKSYSDILHFR